MVCSDRVYVSPGIVIRSAAALALLRELLSYIPSNNLSEAPRRETEDPPDRLNPNLDTLVPDNPNKPYDIKDRSASIEYIEDPTGFEQQMQDFLDLNAEAMSRLEKQKFGDWTGERLGGALEL